MAVKSGNALRRNERCAGRPMEDLPNGQNVALNRTLSPSRTCGSVQAGDYYGCTTPAPRSDGSQPYGRTWEEKRHHRSLVPRDAMLTGWSSLRLLAMASPDWDDLCNPLIKNTLDSFLAEDTVGLCSLDENYLLMVLSGAT